MKLCCTLMGSQGNRLLRECGKARQILSANDQTQVVLECFDEQERDFRFDVTRSELENACVDLKATVTQLVQDALAQCGVEDIATTLTAVELIGGGTRIPFVRDVSASHNVLRLSVCACLGCLCVRA